MTRPYLIRTIVQIHAREASAAQRLRSNGVRVLEGYLCRKRAGQRLCHSGDWSRRRASDTALGLMGSQGLHFHE